MRQRLQDRNAIGAAMMVGALALAFVTPAGAVERQILGRRITVRDPVPADTARRSLVVRAAEPHSADPLTGDPTLLLGAGGAVLEISARGGTPSWQTFSLAQGTRADGRPFWRAVGDGFAFADPDGEQGPVQSAVIKGSAHGTLQLSLKLSGRNGLIEVVPPNDGTDGFAALTLSGGDRYCVGFGPDAHQQSFGARLWTARRAPAERCGPAPLPTGEFLALTYNVAGLPEGLSSSHPATNTQQISPKLNAYDLVVVQESWQTPDPNPLAPVRVYHEVLVADATHAYKSVPLAQPLGTDPARPSAQLADGINTLSRFPLNGVVHQHWNECWESAADCLALKGFMVSRTTFAPGVTVDVYTLHMEAGGDPEDDAVRDHGITQLATFINTYSVGNAVMVGGDFNLHTDSEPDSTQFQRLLSEAGLTDVCAALSCPSPGRIDKWLFRSNAAITLTPLTWHFETDVFHDAMGVPLSDHDALAVRFQWQVTP
ncbi:MAG: endonuclease/exonuclease/phosphatase family protein [bacterium]